MGRMATEVVVAAFRRHRTGSVVAVGNCVEAAAVRLAESADRRKRSDALAVVQIGGQLVVFGCAVAGRQAFLVEILEHLSVH